MQKFNNSANENKSSRGSKQLKIFSLLKLRSYSRYTHIIADIVNSPAFVNIRVTTVIASKYPLKLKCSNADSPLLFIVIMQI